jgi:hypothetical protein
MTRLRLLSGTTALVAALLATAPAARADDASLFFAYNVRQGEVDAASDVYIKAFKRNQRHPGTKTLRAIIAADKGIDRVLRAIKTDLHGQAASTDRGRKARTAAFREVRGWLNGNDLEVRGIRALIHHKDARADRLFKRANRTMRRCYRQGRIAVRHFKAVGLKSANGPVSAN